MVLTIIIFIVLFCFIFVALRFKCSPETSALIAHSINVVIEKGKAVPLHAMEALGGRVGIAPTHSRPRH
jgi:hypothetical protein